MSTLQGAGSTHPPMNYLSVGTDKSTLLAHLPDTFLIIDDGELIDQLTLPKRRKVTAFDPFNDSFNPLAKLNHRRVQEFLSVVGASFPEGQNTLTRGTALFQIAQALREGHRRLKTLISDTDETAYAYQLIQRLLLSPVLENVLCNPTNFAFHGTILARLSRAELGDEDCFVLANLLISQYKGPVVIPDFGFYAAPHHTALIRQKRLIAGVNFLDDVEKKMRNQLLLIEDKVGAHCTPADAEVLATFSGLRNDPTRQDNAYNRFIDACIS